MIRLTLRLDARADHESAPRGRHAPPLEVRQDRQRRQAPRAAGAVFARVGYADATAEAIAREVGMSKATFYEHFDNKEDCIVALHDDATSAVLEAMRRTGADYAGSPTPRPRARRHPYVPRGARRVPRRGPDAARGDLGAGPRAMERRDRVRRVHRLHRRGQPPGRRAGQRAAAGLSPHDALAIVGAVVELASRQIRQGEPEDVRDLEPVVERLVLGLMRTSTAAPA